MRPEFSPTDVTTTHIQTAHQTIQSFVRHTPLEQIADLDHRLGARVWLKMETWQRGGSFKLRGAANRLATLSAAERARGIITVSAGNHALGVAISAQTHGIPAIIVVPENASPAKIHALHQFDPAYITVRPLGADYDAAEAAGLDLARDLDLPFISAYNDPAIIAGQGTVALEMLEDEPDLDTLIVPIGGGGLAAGVAVWAHHINPAIRILGAQAAASPTMHASLAAGQLVEVPAGETLADGLAGNIERGSITFPICQREVEMIALVTEDEIAAAIRYLVDQIHVIVEGSGAVGIAALLAGKLTIPASARVGIILTGRNIATARLNAALR